MPSAPPDPNRFQEAIDTLRRRVPMTDRDFEELVDGNHRKAFTIAGVQSLDLLTRVWKAIDKALERGTTLEDFKRDVGQQLEQEWGRPNGARLETIFRTNVQSSYSAGRHEQQTKAAVLRRRPFWEFVPLLDDRTTAICRPLKGFVRPAEDPVWKKLYPPLHFACRSGIKALTREQAEDRVAAKVPDVTPLESFGGPPTTFEPDLSKYPERLLDAYRKKNE